MIAEYFAGYRTRLNRALEMVDPESITRFVEQLEAAYQNERQVLIMGNGGSGATASHAVCDLNKGVSLGLSKRFRVICLNDNVATTLAYGNDLAFDAIFVEPLKNFLRPSDLVVGISGSGNSPNVIRAIEYANAHGAHTLGLSGFQGGRLRALARTSVWVPVDDMQIAEDAHMILFHAATQILRSRLAGEASAMSAGLGR